MTKFIGVDLGWYGKPSGLASISDGKDGLRLECVDRMEGFDAILDWVVCTAGAGSAMVAVDAPLVIRNATGIRPAERELNRDFRRFHAGCHAANLGRPFASNVTEFSRRLLSLGFQHGASIRPQAGGRFQIEVHPHAASIGLFGLDRIVKYKRGVRADRARELRRFRRLLATRLPLLDPPLSPKLPRVPTTGPLKPAEDQIDAVLCAYIAAHYWRWGAQRNRVYGDERSGYVVVPETVTLPKHC